MSYDYIDITTLSTTPAANAANALTDMAGHAIHAGDYQAAQAYALLAVAERLAILIDAVDNLQ